jgi:hypothetical protein
MGFRLVVFPSVAAVWPLVRFQVVDVFLVLAHERRRILQFAVTSHPTAEWTRSSSGKLFRGTARHRHRPDLRERQLRMEW